MKLITHVYVLSDAGSMCISFLFFRHFLMYWRISAKSPVEVPKWWWSSSLQRWCSGSEGSAAAGLTETLQSPGTPPSTPAMRSSPPSAAITLRGETGGKKMKRAPWSHSPVEEASTPTVMTILITKSCRIPFFWVAIDSCFICKSPLNQFLKSPITYCLKGLDQYVTLQTT